MSNENETIDVRWMEEVERATGRNVREAAEGAYARLDDYLPEAERGSNGIMANASDSWPRRARITVCPFDDAGGSSAWFYPYEVPELQREAPPGNATLLLVAANTRHCMYIGIDLGHLAGLTAELQDYLQAAKRLGWVCAGCGADIRGKDAAVAVSADTTAAERMCSLCVGDEQA